MMRFPHSFRWLLPALAVLLLLGGSCGPALQRHFAQGPNTHVYIVRHAEKDPAPGLADPSLTPAGRARALALQKELEQYWLSSIFSTNTIRTQATAQPLAEKLKLPVQPYDARQLAALASRIRSEYSGRAVLIVGHSNTILETVEAFDAARPVPAIGDEDYDYLLEVTLPRDSTRAATAVARRYGLPRR
ncbi:histidine phosphatase family protein [uncultured Hymenobacter sp.]|uniref:SixA phosphatase family protein n=1 Tax=uncultured Hymenobacter sp. TaxID=170016 RepID=UPI0035CBA7C2